MRYYDRPIGVYYDPTIGGINGYYGQPIGLYYDPIIGGSNKNYMYFI